MPNFNLKPKNPIKKGEARNPRGSSDRVRKLGAIKRLTIDELAEVGGMLLRSDMEALEAISIDPKSSVLRYWMAALAKKSIEKGDVQTFDVLMTRLIGKPPEMPVTRDSLEPSTNSDEII